MIKDKMLDNNEQISGSLQQGYNIFPRIDSIFKKKDLSIKINMIRNQLQ